MNIVAINNIFYFCVMLLYYENKIYLQQVSVLFSSFEENIYPQDDGDGLLEKLLDIISVCRTILYLY